METRENFDYDAAVRRVEEIISAIESADFRISDAAPMIKEAAGLIAACRSCLRGMQESYRDIEK